MECGLKFSYEESMNKHMKKPTEDKPFRCAFCNNGYDAEQKTFKCNQCGKTYSSYGGLYTHKRKVHLGVRFEWKECWKQFGKLGSIFYNSKFIPTDMIRAILDVSEIRPSATVEDVNMKKETVIIEKKIIIDESSETSYKKDIEENIKADKSAEPVVETSNVLLPEKLDEEGQIIVEVYKSRNIEKKGILGKADPYVKLTLVLGKDDALGSTFTNVTSTQRHKQLTNQWISLKNYKSGEILLSAEFVSEDTPKEEQVREAENYNEKEQVEKLVEAIKRMKEDSSPEARLSDSVVEVSQPKTTAEAKEPKVKEMKATKSQNNRCQR